MVSGEQSALTISTPETHKSPAPVSDLGQSMTQSINKIVSAVIIGFCN